MSIDDFYKVARTVWRYHGHKWPRVCGEDAIQEAVLACVIRSPQYDTKRASELTFYQLVCLSRMRELHKQTVRLKRGNGHTLVSLDDELADGLVMVATIPAAEPGPCASAIAREEMDMLKAAIADLPQRWQAVAEGIINGDSQTSIARRMRVTPQRISGLRNKILGRLRRYLVSSRDGLGSAA